MPKYRTTRDVVIPAGTDVSTGLSNIRFFSTPVVADLEVTKDVTHHWYMDLKEGLEEGWIEEYE